MLCYSTASLPDGYSLSRIAETLASGPFRGVELAVTPALLERAGDGPYWRGVRDDFAARGLSFRNVHLGAPHLMGPEPHRPGLSSLDAQGRARKAEAAARCMDIAGFLEAPHLTLTTGLPEGADAQERQTDALKAELAGLIRRKPAGLDLLIEQEPEHVIHSSAQLGGLGREFPGQVFACFDVGHSEVLGEDIAACIAELGPLLKNIHLEDIKGRVHAHMLYGDGDVDFPSIFRTLREIGYQGDYTPDLYPFKDDCGRALRISAAFLWRHGLVT